MVEPRATQPTGGPCLSPGTHFINDRGFLVADPQSPEYSASVHRKNTVKELLMMRRKRWNCMQQEEENSQPKLKSVKSEAFLSDVAPHASGPQAPGDPRFMNQWAPENAPLTPQPGQYPALCPATDSKLTLFHWQIQQEVNRVGGLSPEQLNMQDSDGDTFLHIAVAQGRRALAYVLATKMAECGSLDVQEDNGQTALQIAAATNQHLIVRDLLDHGAQINTRDLWGRSPLHVCAEKGHFLSLQSMWRTFMGRRQLIDVDVFNYDGLTPLHTAVTSHGAVVKELRRLENPCSYMTTELVQRGQMYVDCIKVLLLMGASLQTKDLKSGRTCLHMASEEANMELLNMMLDQPCSLSIVNAKTFSGNTALHIVSSLQNHGGQAEAVKLLMRKGADPGARNFENELPSQLVPDGPVGEKLRQILKGKTIHD